MSSTTTPLPNIPAPSSKPPTTASPPSKPRSPQCSGFILLHQHPSYSPAAGANEPIDPYAVIPCPYTPCIPHIRGGVCALKEQIQAEVATAASTECKAKDKGQQEVNTVNEQEKRDEICVKECGSEGIKGKGKGGCAKAKWCERHWCGGCKRVNGVGRTARGSEGAAGEFGVIVDSEGEGKNGEEEQQGEEGRGMAGDQQQGENVKSVRGEEVRHEVQIVTLYS